MKRIGNLHRHIISLENLRLADRNAQRGKSRQRGIIRHNLNREGNILMLHNLLKDKKYKTSGYHTFNIYEHKKRQISSLPYYPDRIVHHAIMNYLEPILVDCFISQTYSCIKKRGIHKCLRDLNVALKDKENTIYCLKVDIRKFYPSVDKDLLKHLLRSKLKDDDLLELLDEIIDSNDKGLPLGNYLSQWFSNFYLNGFDHWVKQKKGIRDYFRYCDDMVILHKDKKFLHELRKEIEEYLLINLKLTLSNYQVFPVRSRGIDFLGYKSFHGYILLRKTIKNKFRMMLKRNRNSRSIASYEGWLLHANCRRLRRKLLKINGYEPRRTRYAKNSQKFPGRKRTPALPAGQRPNGQVLTAKSGGIGSQNS